VQGGAVSFAKKIRVDQLCADGMAKQGTHLLLDEARLRAEALLDLGNRLRY
jgi:hypothetical protein